MLNDISQYMPDNYVNPGEYSISSSFCCVPWLSNKEQRILLQVIWIFNAALKWTQSLTTVQMESVGEKRASHSGTFIFPVLLHFEETNALNSFSVRVSQLELCGGLTPILERSTRASCDDTENCANIGLLDETEEPNTNFNSYPSEENSNIHYTSMVRYL